MNDFKQKQILDLVEEKFGIIGNSQPMFEAILKLYQAAPTDLAVLVTGETGTGKEVFAKAIHGLSLRKKYPFVSVNCGAIPETLLESELFGHEKGAFTGATDQRKGFFESANNGTIFLDEIGEMPVGTQVKLLRVLESGEFSRLGSSVVHKVNVRVVAATNRILEREVAEKNFRQDLYFRLKNVHIYLPSLIDHLEDIPLLVEYFAENITSKLGMEYKGFSIDALNMLKALPWQGNVRELKNLIETMMTLEQVSYITPDVLRNYIPAALPAAHLEPVQKESSIIQVTGHDQTKNIELELIFRTLLELKNEVADVKRYIHSLSLHIENLKSELDDTIQLSHKVEVEDQNEHETLNLSHLEKQTIQSALDKSHGNRRQAAYELGISERTLYRKISEFDL